MYALKIYDEKSTMPVAVLMMFITVSVPTLVYFGINKDKYDIKKYNKINRILDENTTELLGKISGIIMIITTIIYLILGFIFELWRINWILYPISGMICGIVAIILQKEK